MNKKVLAALVSTLAFGSVTVAQAADAPAKEDKAPAKAEKGKKAKKDDKKDAPKGGEKSCGGDKGGKGGEKSCGAK